MSPPRKGRNVCIKPAAKPTYTVEEKEGRGESSISQSRTSRIINPMLFMVRANSKMGIDISYNKPSVFDQSTS